MSCNGGFDTHTRIESRMEWMIKPQRMKIMIKKMKGKQFIKSCRDTGGLDEDNIDNESR